MPAKPPRFFCDNCNHEVKRNTRVCPYCGRFFASVRCPSCEYTGSEEEFQNGCPNCGYAIKDDKQTKTKRKKRFKLNFNFGQKKSSTQYLDDQRLPLWVHCIVVCLLAIVLVTLLII